MYGDWEGNKVLTLTKDILEQDTLVVALIPRYRESSITSIEYRLCWEFKAPIFYVYADAITGEDVNYQRQYMIF